MLEHNFLFSLTLIFAGAAVLSTFALITRQSMLVAYIFLGIILGPWGLQWVRDSVTIERVGDIGIIFLLFLLGLHLPPQKLVHMMKKISWVGFASSFVFAVIGYAIGWLFGFTVIESLIIGAAVMFSSTIIGIKLLPTTVLHHQHTGEVMISILLFQDLLAIAVLLIMRAASGAQVLHDAVLASVGFVGAIIFAFLFDRFVLTKLFSRFSRIREYIFLIAIAWCLTMAEIAHALGLSGEIGAFIAGVSLATSPISFYIAESMRSVRDFFLVLFFFSVGASFDLDFFKKVIIPALLLMGLLSIIKPVIFRLLLGQVGELKQVGWEVGMRLGQISEFALIIAYVGMQSHLLDPRAGYLIQAATILSFIVSSYFVVLKYPTPVAMSDRLRRD
jgi:Kef-type K+ transport system membrane component KefB